MTEPERAVTARLEPLTEPEALAAEWQALQARAEHSFFQSWGWIGTWLGTLGAERQSLVLRVVAGEKTVGLGLLVESRQRRHGVIRTRALHLHETGDPRLDELTIERNGLLLARGFEAAALKAAFDLLGKALREGRWDEIALSALDPLQAEAAGALGLPCQTLKDSLCHLVDLAALRGKDADYLESLGKKTRQHLRRSLRLYDELGPLRVEPAADTAAALAAFDELVALHQADWQARGADSALFDATFLDFHRRLIEARFAQGEIQLLTLSAGATRIGVLYLFRYRGRVYSYQWGLAPAEDARLSYGLVADYLSVIHNLESGAESLDFLHGDSLHKRRLGLRSEPSLWVLLQRDRLDLRLEAALRRWKRRRAARHSTETASK